MTPTNLISIIVIYILIYNLLNKYLAFYTYLSLHYLYLHLYLSVESKMLKHCYNSNTNCTKDYTSSNYSSIQKLLQVISAELVAQSLHYFPPEQQLQHQLHHQVTNNKKQNTKKNEMKPHIETVKNSSHIFSNLNKTAKFFTVP